MQAMLVAITVCTSWHVRSRKQLMRVLVVLADLPKMDLSHMMTARISVALAQLPADLGADLPLLPDHPAPAPMWFMYITGRITPDRIITDRITMDHITTDRATLLGRWREAMVAAGLVAILEAGHR